MSKKCMYCTVYCTIHDISIDVLKNMLLDKIVECKRQYTWSVYTSSYIQWSFSKYDRVYAWYEKIKMNKIQIRLL